MDWELVGIDNPNAWLTETNSFSEFLKLTYGWNSGEIWLYNNDLSVLCDEYLFDELYFNLIDGDLKGRIEAVKFLLDGHHYEMFANPSSNPHLESLLQKLSPQTLNKFYIGKITEEMSTQVQKFDLESNISFYTWKGNLSNKRGLAIVRHDAYPFTGSPDFAVIWRLKESDELQRRLKDTFQSIFENADNFRWLKKKTRNPLTFEIKEGISPQTAKVKNAREGIQIPFSFEEEVNIGLVAALPDELQKFKDKVKSNGFSLELIPNTPGDYFTKIRSINNKTYNIVMTHSTNMGNSNSAVTTMKLIHRYNPHFIILIGIAGGNKEFSDLQLGDIVIPTAIYAYEYAKLTGNTIKINTDQESEDGREILIKGQNKKREKETRTSNCGNTLYTAATSFKWNPDKISAKRYKENNKNRKKSKVITGEIVGSGSKLIADDDFVNELKDPQRKLVAIEMEGEGVGLAAKAYNKEFILIKAISDYADPESRNVANKDKWRDYAAEASADFVFQMIESGNIPR